MFAALPRHITADRMIRIACSSIARTPKLLECSQSSLFAAITEAASIGLVPDGILGHAYLVPYGNTCQLIPGYKGLVQLVRQSGEISTIAAAVVRSEDDFSYELGTEQTIRHRPSLDEHDGTYSHVYAVALLKDGGKQCDVMTFGDIEKHKKRFSKSCNKSDSPWNTAPEEMAKKTIIRRLIKLLPVSAEVQRYSAISEEFDAGGYPDQRRSRVSHVEILPPAEPQTETTEPEPQSDDAEFQAASDADNAE
jgi:recombination protein RecT